MIDPAQVQWELEVDTPATIAVLGGGMLAVEAALYARFLGYSVLLFDRGKVGDYLLRWGGQAMRKADGSEATWADVTTPLGLAALEAQHGPEALPSLTEHVTYREYVERYLLPVARTDLLYDSIQVHSAVESISRLGCIPPANCSLEQRSELLFRVLVKARSRGEYSQLCDVILDCLEPGAERVGLAFGGGLAIGEEVRSDRMLHGKQDVLGKQRAPLADKHVLLFGGGWEACATALELSELTKESEKTRVTWVVPKQWGRKGLYFAVEDRDWQTEQRSALGRERLNRLQQLVEAADPAMVILPAWGIEAVAGGGGAEPTRAPRMGEYHHDHDHGGAHDHHDHDHDSLGSQTELSNSGWRLQLQTKSEETLEVTGDVFINCARPIMRRRFAEMLDVQAGAPIEPGGDGEAGNPRGLMTGEPHYYLLGSDCGALPASEVRDRIRAAFSLIGGRRELNLYTTVKPLGK